MITTRRWAGSATRVGGRALRRRETRHRGRDPLPARAGRAGSWTARKSGFAARPPGAKGTHTVGVQRQYTGTAGRIENSQVAVHLVYTGLRGHAAVDRELYIPRSWTCAPDRCRAAGLDEDTASATTPEPAARMIGRFLDAGHRVGWVAGDEVYGGNPTLRTALEEREIGYVLPVACSAEVATRAGKFRAGAPAARVPKRAWKKLSAGAGAKGHRFYDWAVIDLPEPGPTATVSSREDTAPGVLEDSVRAVLVRLQAQENKSTVQVIRMCLPGRQRFVGTTQFEFARGGCR